MQFFFKVIGVIASLAAVCAAALFVLERFSDCKFKDYLKCNTCGCGDDDDFPAAEDIVGDEIKEEDEVE